MVAGEALMAANHFMDLEKGPRQILGARVLIHEVEALGRSDQTQKQEVCLRKVGPCLQTVNHSVDVIVIGVFC